MDSEKLQDIFKRLDEHEERLRRLEGSSKVEVENKSHKKQSVKEFILSKNPDSDVKKTLVIAYYLEKYDGLESFTIQDLEGAFRKAKEPVPDNLNDKVNKNIRKGYIMDAKGLKDKKKAWTITSSGERFIENNLIE